VVNHKLLEVAARLLEPLQEKDKVSVAEHEFSKNLT